MTQSGMIFSGTERHSFCACIGIGIGVCIAAQLSGELERNHDLYYKTQATQLLRVFTASQAILSAYISTFGRIRRSFTYPLEMLYIS